MPSQPTTRWQVSGYRFLVRRMEHALVRRDVRMLHDPMRSQSRALAVGAVLASLGLAACAVLALIRPQDKMADNKIVVAKDSGAMFVVLDNVVHPVLNLASARLAAGSSDKPAIVKESELEKKPRGPLVGIPGAPSALPHSDGTGRTWSVCDSIGADGSESITNSVLVGDTTLGAGTSTLGSGEALLLKSKNDTYLVYDGKRAKIDLANRAVVNALALDGATPRPVSPGLLNAIPEVPAIAPPRIDGAGSPPLYSMPGEKVGAVIQVPRGDSKQYYVVLRDGVQLISAATAELIRFNDSQGAVEIAKLAPDALNRVPTVEQLDVASFPESAPSVVDSTDAPVSCLSWKPIQGGSGDSGGRSGAEMSLMKGRSLPIPSDAKMVTLAQADGPGDKTDTAYLHPGAGAFVQTTGMEADSRRKDSTFFVADTGVRYGVTNAEAAKALGFDSEPEAAPWSIVSLLAPGPALGREQAMVAHDGVAPDEAPAALTVSGK